MTATTVWNSPGVHIWDIPDHIDEATFTVEGGGGGAGDDYEGGDGGVITATIDLTGLSQIGVHVADGGDGWVVGDNPQGGSGRVDGEDSDGDDAGAGGGMSAIFHSGNIVKAGGGGGGGEEPEFWNPNTGGDGADNEVGGDGGYEQKGGHGTAAVADGSRVKDYSITTGGADNGGGSGALGDHGGSGRISAEYIDPSYHGLTVNGDVIDHIELPNTNVNRMWVNNGNGEQLVWER